MMWTYWACIALMAISTWSLSATSWFFLWLTLEVSMILAAPIILTHASAGSSESVLKYFLIQAISGMLILIGLMSGAEAGLLVWGALLLKLGGAPMFMWVPYVMKTQSWLSIFIMSTLMKVPGLVVLSHVCPPIAPGVGALTVLAGCLPAVALSAVKPLMAYSSVAHTGWLIIMTSTQSAWVCYFVLYSIVSYFIISFMARVSTKSVYQTMVLSPSVALVTSILMLSLSGFPPLLGFELKVLSLSAAASASPVGAMLLSLGLTAALFYYLSVFISAWLMATSSKKSKPGKASSLASVLSMSGVMV